MKNLHVVEEGEHAGCSTARLTQELDRLPRPARVGTACRCSRHCRSRRSLRYLRAGPAATMDGIIIISLCRAASGRQLDYWVRVQPLPPARG